MTGLVSPAAQPMLARRLLRLAVVAALQKAKTDNNFDWAINSPGDWSTPGDNLVPGHVEFLVNCGDDFKTSVDQSATMAVPKFNTDVEIRVQARLQVADSAGALDGQGNAQDQLEMLGYTVENILLTDFSLGAAVQRFNSVRTTPEIDAEGREHLAGFAMDLSLQIYEEFDASVLPPASSTWPVVANPIVALQTIGLMMDLQNVFDPNGTYQGAEFPDSVVPAPRTHGPDGRIEAGMLLINLGYLGPGGLDETDPYDGFMLDFSTLE